MNKDNTINLVIGNKKGWTVFSVTAVFLVIMKYGMQADISWWLIISVLLAPFIVVLGIFIMFVLFIMLCTIGAFILDEYERYKRRKSRLKYSISALQRREKIDNNKLRKK